MNRERTEHAWNCLKSKYSITKEEYEEMFEKQSGCCYICNIPSDEAARGVLFIDHDHDDRTKIRGLLCNSCNLGIGWFEENPKIMERAISYLVE